jgi:hypothetical protein
VIETSAREIEQMPKEPPVGMRFQREVKLALEKLEVRWTGQLNPHSPDETSFRFDFWADSAIIINKLCWI